MRDRFHLAWGLVILASTAATAATAEAGTQPVVTEQVPVSASSRPFFAANIDLAAHGYVEDEYFVSGHGDVYEYTADGSIQVQTAAVPYKSRILVRRPSNTCDFNGVVLFELLNPTAGFDIDFEWHFTRELLLAEGYAWVGITMKDTAVDALAAWDPDRYGTLSLPDNGLAYPMFAQVAALLRDDDDPANPLAGFGVHYVIATGYSQTADYLTTFGNEFHELALARDGRHAIDGYLQGGGAGAGRRINSTDAEFYLDERRMNSVRAPLIRVQAETEVAVFTYSSAASRQPDSQYFRMYEVPGASHADRDILQRTGEVIAREFGGPVLPQCTKPLNPLEIGPVHRSSLSNLVRWLVHHEAPPASQPLVLDGADEVIRDSDGNATGGTRLPDIAVPLGSFQPDNSGPGPCILAGSFAPFDADELAALYPSHAAYVWQVRLAARALRAARYLLGNDAKAYIEEASASDVGQ
ncbi:alpha/beta hydrolase domain-containing protein [Haliangium sp.]|uniref:alpha/beta hydrolase domain-containing protein n=1 Tax=Haliangium sp. TaxID=2663208 RepID=UPI003D13E999